MVQCGSTININDRCVVKLLVVAAVCCLIIISLGLIHQFSSTPNRFRGLEQTDDKLIEYIRNVWLREPSSTEQRNISDLWLKANGDHSEYKQSAFVDRLLQKKEGGFYVECGAADGGKDSNSLMFELERGWNGVLIEANPSFFHRLSDRHRRAYTLNACLSPETRSVTASFVNSGLLSGISHLMQANHAKYVYSNDYSVVDVECFPLYSVLQAVGVTHVDLLSLDVEGAELDILKTIPFDKMTIDVMLVEFGVYDGKVNKKLGISNLEVLKEYFRSLKIYDEVGQVGRVDYVWRRNQESLPCTTDYAPGLCLGTV